MVRLSKRYGIFSFNLFSRTPCIGLPVSLATSWSHRVQRPAEAVGKLAVWELSQQPQLFFCPSPPSHTCFIRYREAPPDASCGFYRPDQLCWLRLV